MSGGQLSKAELDNYLHEVCDQPGIEEKMLYELAFEKAFEFDKGLPPSSIFEEGQEVAAQAVLGIALGSKLDPCEIAVLRDIYDALTGRGAFRLKLSNARKGPQRTGEQLLSQAQADRTMLRLVNLMTERLGKREAAINAVSHALKVSRATIFNQMKRAKHFDRSVFERRALRQATQSIKLPE